jgi:hypothetical protein
MSNRRIACAVAVLVPATLLGCGEGVPDHQPDRGPMTGAGGSAGADGTNEGGSAECEGPDAPILSSIHAGAILRFLVPSGGTAEVGAAADPGAVGPDRWWTQDSWILPEQGAPLETKVFARIANPGCVPANQFMHVYSVRDRYPGPVGAADSTAIASDDARFVAWASGFVEPVGYGTQVDAPWRTPEKALGPAGDDVFGVVSLGNGGSVTLTFDPPIADGPGDDFAVFENGTSDAFLEVALVEVSSDGVHFARFDSAYLGAGSVPQYGGHDTRQFEGLAGKYRVGWGNPFDLQAVRYRHAVQAGWVDLARITHVRIVDVVGDGATVDSFGHPIYDPYPTVGSGGFDLDAIGVLHVAP